MRYKGKKALMKCCRSCSDKKGIKCMGNHNISKYDGFKFCKNHNPRVNQVNKRLSEIKHIVDVNNRINYYSEANTETSLDEIKNILEPEVKKSVDGSLNGFKNIIHNFRKLVITLGKSKEVQEAYKR